MDSGPDPPIRQISFSLTPKWTGSGILAKSVTPAGLTVPIRSGPRLPSTHGDSGEHPGPPSGLAVADALVAATGGWRDADGAVLVAVGEVEHPIPTDITNAIAAHPLGTRITPSIRTCRALTSTTRRNRRSINHTPSRRRGLVG